MKTNFQAIIFEAGVVGLAELYRTGAITPLQVLEDYSDRILQHNSLLGAYIFLREADASKEAEASTRRWAAGKPLSILDGVPIGVKANIALAGAPWHAGIRAYADRIAYTDAACLASIRQNGAIALGLLNMDEGGLGASGDNPWLGRTQNPYRYGYSPGGSSSGAGAAVAGGLCAAALGTDTMGSVRIPAAFCGCVGYKPSRGIIAANGIIPLSESLDHIGVLARSVSDCQAIAQGAVRNPPAPALLIEPTSLRLGVPINLNASEIDDSLQAAIDALIRQCNAKGVQVIPIDFQKLDLSRLRKNCLLVTEIEAMRSHGLSCSDGIGFSEGFMKMLRWGGAQPEVKVLEAYRSIELAGTFMRELFSKVSALILPTVGSAAFSFEDKAPASLAEFAVLANASGVAAVAIPMGMSREGLPLSAQLLGLDEATTLGFASFAAGMVNSLPTPF